MRQGRELLGGLHPGKQGDLSAKGQAFGGCNPLRVIELYPSGFHEPDKAFPEAAHFTLHFGQRGQLLAFGLIS